MAGEPRADFAITATPLDGGGLMLSRPAETVRQDRAIKEPARIITMAWGERYLSDLLLMTIPAMLAPGNIPAFAEHFDCELVVVTERRFFSSFANSPVVLHALKHCNVRLLPIDDLLSPWYGITLTYALVRGFADLGPKMVDTHLVFINADFILADGSYRKLAEKILQGERLVVSPSYCMVLEETIETLQRHYNPADCSLSISKRDMAALIIAHRHNTIRAKTVNQRFFRIHRYDQFYWHVDEHTLLGHQMPIAVAYMRPERVLTEMPTFWDYGVISEFCPTTKPCVLGDSDDFLFGELRTEGTFRELLHLGWPSVEEIAHDLSTFTTHDHRVYGRFQLTLHSRDLPSHVGREHEKLQRFVDSVYEKLTPPVSYRDHVFWAAAFPSFRAIQAEQAEKLQSEIDSEIRARSDAGTRLREAEMLESRLRELEMRRSSRALVGSSEMRAVESKLFNLDAEYRQARKPIEQELEYWRAHRRKELIALQDEISAVARAMAGLAAPQKSEPASEDPPDFKTLAKPIQPSNRAAYPSGLVAPNSKHVKKKPAIAQLDLLVRLYRLIFGRLVNTTKWHPMHLALKPTVSAIASQDTARNALLISSGGPLATAMSRSIAGKKITLTPKMIISGLYGNLIGSDEKFDLCLCDLSAGDLLEFRSILSRIQPILTPNAKVIVFHYNADMRNHDHDTFEFTRRLFPLIGTAEISFAGSFPGALAIKWFQRSLESSNLSTIMGRVALAAVLAVCGPLARLAHYLESKRSPQTYPRYCTSMTIKIGL